MNDTKQVVRWGVLSTAKIATKVSQAIRRARGTELAAVASRTLERATNWAKEHKAVHAYGSYEELLDDPQIDAVYIPLPPSMHAQWTIRAAERGKHVLCEKPLAKDTAESVAMANACRAHGVQLMDGVMWVHHERTEAMRRKLDDGVLGKPRRVTAAFSFNWDEIPAGNIRLDRELAGGCLGDLGYYCVRAITWALQDLPVRVYATARYYNDVELNLSGLLWFANDRVASFDCGFDTVYRKWFEITGNQGSIVCDDFVVPWAEEKSRFWVHGVDGTSSEHSVNGCVQEVRMIERFSDIVRSGKLDDRWPAEAITTMRICDALDESARAEKIVELRR